MNKAQIGAQWIFKVIKGQRFLTQSNARNATFCC